MIVWKVMLQAAATGAVLGPLAAAAFGPVQMKPPPDPPWRTLPRAEVAAYHDFTIAPPGDVGPPAWTAGAAPDLRWQAAYTTTPAPPEPASPPEPAPHTDQSDEKGVIVHRGGGEKALDSERETKDTKDTPPEIDATDLAPDDVIADSGTELPI